MKPPFRIKCCGLTREEDVHAAVDAGFDALGLVFVRRSKRFVGLGRARQLRAVMPSHVACVALFMDALDDMVGEVIAAIGPDVLQFHGRETNGFCQQFDKPWIKAVAMGSQTSSRRLTSFRDAAALLLDGHATGALGGSGERFDWSQVPGTLKQPWILAGGLTPENVAEAIGSARPWGVDVSSGVESSPGRKDAVRMERFVAAVHASGDALSGDLDD